MTRPLLVLAAASALGLGGCASIQQAFSGWFGSEPEPSAAPGAAAQPAETFFAAVDGLAVHSDPTAASKIVGRLALHEKIARTQLERGYAYVTSATSGVSGWVDNARLIWRLPAAGAAAAGAPAAAPAVAPAADAATAPSAPPGTAPADDAAAVPPSPVPTATAEPAAPPPTAVPTVQPPATQPAPEMFDPY